jgi:hypothetical protein
MHSTQSEQGFTMARFWTCLTVGVAFLAVFSAIGYYLLRPHRMNRHYDFAIANAPLDDCVVTCRLRGTFQSTEDLTSCGTPYRLNIAIESQDGSKCEVVRANVSFTDMSTEAVVFHADSCLEIETQQLSNGRYCTFVTTEGIQLEFQDYELTVTFEIVTSDGTIERTVTLEATRDYRENHSNDLIDMFLSA